MTAAEFRAFDAVETAVNALAEGRLILVTDDERRENEGDLVLAASKATPETINFMIRHARGLICVPMLDRHLERLGIADMVPTNRESFRTAFTVSVDAAHGITTGISASDRAQTVRTLASPESTPSDLVRPGHIFPLRARAGGVLERAGHTEAALDLVTMAGLEPCAVICEVLNDDGSMARLSELAAFKRAHGLPMISVAQLIEHRLAGERMVERIESRPLPTAYGDFTLHLYRSLSDKLVHTVLTMGELHAGPVLVRVQSEHLWGDLFQARGMEGHAALESALRQIAAAGQGVFVYLQSERKWPAPRPRKPEGEEAIAQVDLELRKYGIGAQILTDLGLKEIRLLTSRKKRLVALRSYGLEIVEHVPL
jgi:3,4-dihydroxy 2-butanone 4-phosphate synthase / GTP cyclohydrolase II